MRSIAALIERLPEGHSVGLYRGVRYGITKSSWNAGRSFKVFGRALDGSDFVSLNCYLTAGGEHLRPCEMPAEKVVAFLEQVVVVPTSAAVRDSGSMD